MSVGSPLVLVAIRHRAMRRFTLELIRHEHQAWMAAEPDDGELLADALGRLDPDVLVVDDGDFPSCCRSAIDAFPPSRVVVVGVEPDGAYEAAAVRAGAGAWVPRERVGEELGAVMRVVLNNRHELHPVEALLVESAACHLCDDAASVLSEAERDGRLRLRRVALDSDEGRAVVRTTRAPIPPIVLVDGELLGWGRLSRGKLRRRLAQLEGVR